MGIIPNESLIDWSGMFPALLFGILSDLLASGLFVLGAFVFLCVIYAALVLWSMHVGPGRKR